jgi:predicted DNA repair protein MutK
MSKVAAKKTAGVLGDDLALNAQQVTGVDADRELPVVWAVAKGSLVNKAILVPAALAISAFAPWADHAAADDGRRLPVLRGLRKAGAQIPAQPGGDAAHALAAGAGRPEGRHGRARKDKIKGAVRTDFILSAEIIVISLGTVAQCRFMQQVAVLVAIAW